MNFFNKYIKTLLIFMLANFFATNILLADQFPVEKGEYLFKNYDISNIALGYSGIAKKSQSGITTNPATLNFMQNNYLEIGYNYSDVINVFQEGVEENKKIDYLALTSSQGGFYYKTFSSEKEEINSKYDFKLKEFGLSFTSDTKTLDGLHSGLTLKGYFGNIMQGINQSGEINLKLDRGYGYGIDLGFLYRANYVYAGLVWKDILGKIYWSEYDDVKVDGQINLGLGFDLGILSTTISANKILKDTSKIHYGYGMELLVFKLPREYSNFMLKGLEIRLRTGKYSDKFRDGNQLWTSGIELKNDKYFIKNSIVSDRINPINGEEIIYKSSFGIKFNNLTEVVE
ncbi:MAG: hypothetical protein ACQERZ_00040 [Fusobacteriota bacterium]